MEEMINIAKILKNKPKGTRLYSPIFGECAFSLVREETDDICVKKHNGEKAFFDSKGLYNALGECLLFPSREMRDWSKFAWKKGDVLVSNDGKIEVIFEKFRSDTYQSFIGKHHLDSLDGNLYYLDEGEYPTFNFNIETEDAAQSYINTIEERLGGKLNRETLEVEKAQPEFKDGDIAYADYGYKQAVFIVSGKTNLSEGYNSFIALDLRGLTLDMGCRMSFFKKDLCKLRLATAGEKQQLFDALAKENKAWDAEKKQIVDLKPKVEFKPFDKVLCRNSKDDTWEADFFARLTRKEIDYTQSGKYLCVGDLWMYCIPYNEDTKHLLGTTDEWKGGEG